MFLEGVKARINWPAVCKRIAKHRRMQSSTPLNRDFFARPLPELGLSTGTILKVVQPLHGVPEAGNYWFQMYHRHHVERLKMSQSTYDPYLLHTSKNGFAIVGLQTDDTLLLADKTFAKTEEENSRKQTSWRKNERNIRRQPQ